MSKHVFISPHLDDAILSCGEYIERLVKQGECVLVLTIFTGFPNPEMMSEGAKQFHKMCNLDDEAYKHRCMEDICATSYLGCDYRHLSFFECLYRIDTDGRSIYPTLDDIFDYKKELEQDNCAVIQKRLMVELKNFDFIYVPSAIGNHADHVLVNQVIENIKSEMNGKVYYYLDFPYSIYDRCNDQVKDCLNRHKKILVDITEYELRKKISAIKKYSSQIEVLFETEEGMINSVKTIASRFRDGGLTLCLLEDEVG